MVTNEQGLSRDEQKKKIRERYKGIDPELLGVIPAKEKIDIYSSSVEQRVAVYARVSTDDPRQTSSYELQKNYYEDLVYKNPAWTLVDIYADEGISGTSLKHREEFKRMIADCQQGKIDLIITKSVSRFARNIVDCISYVRQLAAMRPPVGVLFETERICTLDGNSEMSLSFLATLAQEESHNKSEIMNASIEMRFKHGIFLTPALLGYDKDPDGNLVVNEDQADTVRLMFFMFLCGNTPSEIAKVLTDLGRESRLGNTEWSGSGVLQTLQNERYCGDVLARKTWTPSYLDHKSRKNQGDRNQYYQHDHHDAIISRDDFTAVQMMIRNSKYGHKGYLPTLSVIQSGILKGFVPVHPTWSFSADEYIEASRSVSGDSDPTLHKAVQYECQSGEFDLRGFEVARGQFFSSKQLALSLSRGKISFNSLCLNRFPTSEFVELLFQAERKLLAVRPCENTIKNAVRWSKKTAAGARTPREVNISALHPTLLELMNWKETNRYQVYGDFYEREGEAVLVFDLEDAVTYIAAEGSRKKVKAYPGEWADSFGDEFYQIEMGQFKSEDGTWNAAVEGVPVKADQGNKASKKDYQKQVSELIGTLQGNNK